MTNETNQTNLTLGCTFEDYNGNSFLVITTDRGLQLVEDNRVLLEDGDLYIFESLQEIEDMFRNENNPITSIKQPY